MMISPQDFLLSPAQLAAINHYFRGAEGQDVPPYEIRLVFDWHPQRGRVVFAQRVDMPGRLIVENGHAPRSSPWSAELIAQTEAIFADLLCAPDGCIHLKHRSDGYAHIRVQDALAERYLIAHKKTGEAAFFHSLAALIEAGWVVD